MLDLVDLPGYGYARRSKAERRGWGPLVESFLRERPGLFAVVLIIDVRRGLEEDDAGLVDLLDHLGRETILVATKLDKLSPNKRKPALAAVQKASGRRVIGFSSVERTGVADLWRVLLRASHLGAPEA